MKKIVLSIIAAAMSAMALAQTATAETKHYTQYLTTDAFCAQVFNYRANPQAWKFEGKRPCIIDFYATWCGPCRALAPVLEQLAKKYNGQIDVYKVDVDKEKELAAVFGISSIPSLLFVPQEGTPQMVQGAAPYEQLVQVVEAVLIKK